jgi:hypothetical protein
LAARNYVDCSNPVNIDQMVKALQKFSDNNGPIAVAQVSFGAVTATQGSMASNSIMDKEAELNEVATRLAMVVMDILKLREKGNG